MTKLTGGKADAFVRHPDATTVAALIYGPDEGQVRERANRMTRAIVADPSDPFRVAELSAAQLKEDPAVVGDECAAMAFGGGRRVVRLIGATDAQAAPVLSFLANPRGDALLIVTAGNLPPRSKLRSAFETSQVAAAIACYPLEGAALVSALQAGLSEAGLRIEPDAISLLSGLLANDFAALQAEVEKLRLYMGEEKRPIAAADVLACCGDQSAHDVSELGFAVGNGDQKTVQKVTDRLFAEGQNPVAAVRGVARHFERLLQARGGMDHGKSSEQAMKDLRPAVFFRDATPFRSQLEFWPSSALLAAIDRLVTIEQQCKTTGIPAVAAAQRGFMEIASLAARNRAGRGRR